MLAFSSPLKNDTEFAKEHSIHLTKHGDGVREITFLVQDAQNTFNVAVSRGCKPVGEIKEYLDRDGKKIVMGSIQTYGDTIHSFLQRDEGVDVVFLPGFREAKQDPINDLLGQKEYGFIDHVVANHPLGEMEPTVQWYEKMLDFHRFWSVDDSVIHTEYR
jgi:4-hydroxyphenylpyruvate dioxygenase